MVVESWKIRAVDIDSNFCFTLYRHACPGRFLAIQEIKTVGSLMISKYSKIEIQDKSKTHQSLFSGVGTLAPTGLIFTSRGADL